jgi:hypothetical protein
MIRLLANLMTGPEHFERVMNTTESMLSRIVGLLDGMVWYDGIFRGAVVASLFWLYILIFRQTKATTVILAALVLSFSALANAQEQREVSVSVPSYQGVNANAPIPTKYHLRNEGGSDGAGLCVPTSITINGWFQGVRGLQGGKVSKFWQTAKSRPGGYGPDKLIALLKETLPGEEFTSYTGTNRQVLHDWSAKGYPIGATMNTGELYGYRPIHHMISLIHYTMGGWACVVDNNDPGNYHWMRSTEYDRRWPDGGVGWAFILNRMPPRQQIGLALFILAIGGLLYYELEAKSKSNTKVAADG